MATSPKFRRATARRLRANQTGAEVLLWRKLRTLETRGTHLRRQVPIIGPHVVDFACLALRLIVELDGSQHGDEPVRSRDEDRTRWLESEGYSVLRFWNSDIVTNLKGALETVYAALYGSRDTDAVALKHRRRRKDHPTPTRFARRPSPSRGG
jgi:very-short-patch-repair endonuclease